MMCVVVSGTFRRNLPRYCSGAGEEMVSRDRESAGIRMVSCDRESVLEIRVGRAAQRFGAVCYCAVCFGAIVFSAEYLGFIPSFHKEGWPAGPGWFCFCKRHRM